MDTLAFCADLKKTHLAWFKRHLTPRPELTLWYKRQGAEKINAALVEVQLRRSTVECYRNFQHFPRKVCGFFWCGAQLEATVFVRQFRSTVFATFSAKVTSRKISKAFKAKKAFFVEMSCTLDTLKGRRLLRFHSRFTIRVVIRMPDGGVFAQKTLLETLPADS